MSNIGKVLEYPYFFRGKPREFVFDVKRVENLGVVRIKSLAYRYDRDGYKLMINTVLKKLIQYAKYGNYERNIFRLDLNYVKGRTRWTANQR